MNFSFKKSEMNFRVSVAASLPATGNENDIVVISETDMQNWILSPEKPKGIPNLDGDVWIRYSVKDATRNLLRNNAMLIATIAAWQYIGGSWVSKTANSYQNGKWVDWWRGELYEAENEYTSYTGGFTAKAMGYDAAYPTAAEPALERGTNYVKATQNGSLTGGAVVFANKIDLSKYSSLKFTGEVYNTGVAGASALCIWSEIGTYQADNRVAILPAQASSKLVNGSLDVSGLSGEYYVGFFLYNTGSYVNITKMWLE